VVTFCYIARTAAGERVTGTVAGTSEQAVLAQLQSRQLVPVEVTQLRPPRQWRRGVSTRRLSEAYRQLGDLLSAGVPLLRGLRLLGRRKSVPALSKVLSEVADAVADGSRLADAMSAHPEVFPEIQVAMVRAGERGGFLDEVMQRLALLLEHQADLRTKIIGALIYPALLMIVAVGIVIFALVGLVPRFETFYADIDLPLPTRVLLAASALFTSYWLPLTIVLVLLAWVAAMARARPNIRRRMSGWQLQVPKLGPLLRRLSVARFCRVLGTLLTNAVPMLSAMQISKDIAGHPLMVEAIEEAADAVRAGEPLATSFGESPLFEDDIVEMISVGESANNLPDVLLTIADTIEKQVDRMLNVLVRLVEPLLLLLLAGIVVFIFVALVVPMLRMSASM
jgi:general secretion pathway protein F/type IV pilus assembly protein PilC